MSRVVLNINNIAIPKYFLTLLKDTFILVKAFQTVRHIVYAVMSLRCSIIYTQHLLHVSPSMERDSCSFSLPEVSSVFPHVKGVQIEGLTTESVICCTDCKAPWDKFVILGYINKIDLTWLGWLLLELTLVVILSFVLIGCKTPKVMD